MIDGCFAVFNQWLDKYSGFCPHRDFALEESGATVAIFGWVPPNDVCRFIDYMTGLSESVTQAQNIPHEQAG
jgi:hypothetical protein